MITDKFLETLRKASAGFSGTFVFDPAHSEDLGIGAPEIVDFDDRLVYVPVGGTTRDDDGLLISDELDENVGRAIAAFVQADEGSPYR